MARGTPEQRAEASLQRRAAKPSRWQGFSEFMAAYDYQPVNDMYKAADVIVARGEWESGRPSQKMRVAIMVVLQRFPAVTLDAQTGRRLSAGEWLMKLWPGPSPADLQAMIADTGAWYDALQAKEALDRAQGIEPGMAELVAMVEALEGGGQHGL